MSASRQRRSKSRNISAWAFPPNLSFYAYAGESPEFFQIGTDAKGERDLTIGYSAPYDMGMAIHLRREPERFWLIETHKEKGKCVMRRLKYLGSKRPTPEELEGLKAEYAHLLPPKKRKPKKDERSQQ